MYYSFSHSYKCALPSYPANGQFTVSGRNKNLPPGTIVDEFSLITYSCNTNYDASTVNVFATCEAGNWDIPPPKCKSKFFFKYSYFR